MERSPATDSASGGAREQNPVHRIILVLIPLIALFASPVLLPPTAAEAQSVRQLQFSPTSVAVREGLSATYRVHLLTAPAANVTVRVSFTGSKVAVDTDAGASGAQDTLTFSTSNWNTWQTVTVTGVQDSDARNEAVALTHAISGGLTGSENLAVSVTDDDTPTAGVHIDGVPSSLRLDEGASTTYRVQLTAAPPSDVTVTITGTVSLDSKLAVDTDSGASGNQNTLIFTPTNWSTAQPVTLTALQDDDGQDETGNVYYTMTGGVSRRYWVQRATVLDDDARRLRLSSAAISLPEGSSATYRVRLASRPTANVTVTISSTVGAVTVDTDSGASGNQNTLAFTPANFSTAQSVTVRAGHDADGVDDTATLTHTASGASEYASVTDSLMVTVWDDDARLVLSHNPVTVAEGGSSTYTVKLSHQPRRSVTVGIVALGSLDLTLDTDSMTAGDQSTLTFTTSNWNVPQPVTISAADDTDANDETGQFFHQGKGFHTFILRVKLTDNDVVRPLYDPANLTVPEGGSSTYRVQISKAPTSNVVVTISETSADVSVDADPMVAGDQSTLAFTPTNWSTARTVTVRAAQDPDAGDDVVALSHTLTGDDHDTVTDNLAVTVNDDETAALELSPTRLALTEGGTAKTYTVKPNVVPTANLTVTVSTTSTKVSVDTDTGTTGNQNTLTFTPANWSTAQTVTVKPANDPDAGDESATLKHKTAGAAEFSAVTGDVAVTVDDDETAAVTVTGDPVSVNEGSSKTYSVKLAVVPSGNVTVTISGASGEVTVDTDTNTAGNQNTLAFTPANFSTAQSVTVSAGQDADALDDTATLRHALTGAAEYDALSDVDLDVTVTDDETAGLTLSPTSLTVTETDAAATGSYTVKLDSEPSASVTVTITRASGDADVTVADTDSGTTGVQNTLTFTTANWNTAQTVTVNVAPDDDAVDDTATLRHAASGATEYAALADVDLEVTVTDDETAGLTLSPTSLTVTETDAAATGSYTVKLDSEPSASVTVTITRASGDADVTVADTDSGTTGVQNTLTFTTANWNTAQTVTVNVAPDDDAVDDTATLRHAVTGATEYAALADVDLDVTVTDDETAGLTLSPTSLTVTETDAAATGSYTVKLDSEPSASVTVTITRASGDADVTVADTDSGTTGVQNTLTFTTANWNTAQTVTVNVAPDDDAVDDTATLRHAVTGATEYAALADVDLDVTVTDDETAGLTLSPTSLTVTETDAAATGSYTVKLDSEPSASVTVTITRASGDADVTVADTDSGTTGVQNTLTFTTANWNTAQTVTVNVAPDDDAVDDTATLRHAASGATEYAALADVDLDVTVTDDETAGLTLSPTSLTVTETDAAATGSYTVKLDSEPSASVTVTITRASGDADVTVADTDSGTTGVQNTLTFTTANWNTAQTVTVNVAPDDDAVDDTATLRHAVTGATEYGSVAKDLDVTVTDDETAGLTLSPTSLTVTETDAAATGSYTVKLDSEPSASVTVTITRASGDADVTVADTDSGTTGVQNTLTFTTANWNTAQTVTVNVAPDDDAVDDTATLRHAVTGATEYAALADVDLDVTVTDDETAGLTLSPTSLTVTETDAAATGSYTVKLDSEPSASVTVTITRASGDADVTVADTDSGTTGVQNTLTFTTANWNTAQTVTVNVAPDDDAVDDTATLRHAVTGATEYGSVAKDLDVTVTDDETAGLTLSPTSLTVTETDAAATGSYTVKLDSEPSASVTVTITRASGDADVTVADTDSGTTGVQNTLTFTTANWNTAQTVTVNVAPDDDAVDDTATLRHAASGATEYAALADVDLSVTVTDDETAGLTLSPTSLTVTETDAAATGSYTVKLDSEPSASVTVTITRASGDADVTVADTDSGTTGVQNTLTFTTANWNTAQTVTVNVAPDDDAVDDTATLRHAASGATEYAALADVDLEVTVTDDETAGLTLSPTSLTVTETDAAATGSYTVKLDSEPSASVTVTITRASGDADVTVADTDSGTTGVQNTLTFTTANWNTAQTVTVDVAPDDDAVDDTATLRHAVTGATEYGSVAKDLDVTVTDDETAGLTLSPTSLAVTETDAAATGSYTVKLDSEPSASVTVTITRASGDADVTVADTDSGTTGVQNTLTFTTANWNTAQTVTVNVAPDDDAVDDTATLRHAASGATEYAALADVDLDVTVTDDETAGLTLSPTSLTVTETDAAATGSYTVKLDSEPSASVTVTITRASGDADVTVADTDSGTTGVQNTLTFTTANWNTAQTVTVDVAPDDDAVDDAATLRHAVTGATEYAALADVDLDVTVTDDETAGLTLSPTSLTVTETDAAATGSYTVKLDSEPSASVTVTITRASGDADITVADTDGVTAGVQNTLTFTTANWNTAQTVTVNVAPDDDAVDDTATLRHAASGATEYGSVAKDLEVTVTDDDGEPSGLPVIRGTVQVGETLSADTSGIADKDGLTNPGWTWQWVLKDGASEDDISEATSNLYTVSVDDEGKKLKVRVSFSDDDSNRYSLTSAATATVVLAGPKNLTAMPGDGYVTLAWDHVPGSRAWLYSLFRSSVHEPDRRGSNGPWQWFWYWESNERPILGDDGRWTARLNKLPGRGHGVPSSSGQPYTVRVIPCLAKCTDIDKRWDRLVYGPPSDPVKFTIWPDSPTLPKPAGFTATPGDGQVTLRWDNIDGATGWMYRQRAGGGQYGPSQLIRSPSVVWFVHGGDGHAPDGLPGAYSHTITGLDNDTEYFFEVQLRSGSSGGPFSEEVSATPRPFPPPPANVRATPGNREVTLNWDAVVGATGYRWAVFGIWRDVPGGAGATTVTATRLGNDVVHTFRVRAVKTAGDGSVIPGVPSEPVHATPSSRVTLAAPNLRVESGNEHVVLHWEWHGHDRNHPLVGATGYEHRMRPAGGSYPADADGGGWTSVGALGYGQISFRIGGLAAGTQYYFQLRAVNGTVPGEASAEVPRNAETASHGTTGASGATAPEAPTGLSAQAGDGAARLAWTAASGGPAATGWQVQRKADAGVWGAWTNIAENNGEMAAHTVADLVNGTLYTFKVRAMSGSAEGAASAPATAVPGDPDVTKPPAPTGVGATPEGVDTVELAWNAVPGATGYHYRVKAGSDGWGVWTAPANVFERAGGEGDATVLGTWVGELAEGVLHRFEVRAANAGGAGEAAAASLDPPDPVAAINVVHKGSSLTVTWEAPARATHYDVTYSGNGANARAAWNRAGTELTITCDIRDGYENQHCVDGGAVYTVGVRARNATGESEWRNSTPASPLQAQQAQQALAAPEVTAEPGDGRVTLRWAAVAGATKYEVRWRAAAAEGEGEGGGNAFGPWASAGGGDAVSTTVTGLDNGTEYEFEMRSGTADAWSGESAPVKAAPQVPPGQATVFLSIPFDREIAVLVVPVANATGYEFRWKGEADDGSDDGPWMAVSHSYFADYDSDLLRLTDLANGTTYRFEVRAKTGEVPGPASAVQTVTLVGSPDASLSVADASVAEPAVGGTADLRFAVTLAPPAPVAVTVRVDYATSDGTATAGADYTRARGTLTFAAGETSKTVAVPVLADAHDDSGETLVLTLSNASGARIADAQATGTITNDGAIPQAWIARFGRTVADQVLDAVATRMRTEPAPGAEVSLAGERIGLEPLFGAAAAEDADASREKKEAWREETARREAMRLAEWLKGGTGSGWDEPGRESRAVTPQELLAGSSFALTAEAGGPGSGGDLVSFWGRGAVSRFDGREGEMTLDGEVATGMVGADWTWGRAPGGEASGRWTAGLLLSHSVGEGGYAEAESSGDVEATLTGLFPWARHRLSERLEAWGVAGYGQGELTVTPKDRPAMKADLALKMAATGLRGTLLDGGEDGLTLAAETDALAVQTSSGRGRGSGAGSGTLASTRATVTRLRLGVEASRPIALGDPGSGSRAASGAVLTPSLEAAVRHDGGDAETGFGLDLGGGLALSDPDLGLDAEIRARGLLSHESGGFRDRGFSGALNWRQKPDSDRGATLSLIQTVGRASSGGADALLSRATLDGLAANDNGREDDLATRRLELRLGYGLSAFGDRFRLTPEAGAGFSNGGRDYSLGLRLTRLSGTGSFELSLEAVRREASANDDVPSEHEMVLRLMARW